MNNNILKKTGAFVGTLRGGKRRFSLLAGVASVLFAGSQLLTSCDLETSSNGNLDGFWHLVKVDTLQTGGVKDTSKKLIFWAFQLNLMKTGEYMARFDHSDGQLSLKEFCLYDNILGNEMLTEEDSLWHQCAGGNLPSGTSQQFKHDAQQRNAPLVFHKVLRLPPIIPLKISCRR